MSPRSSLDENYDMKEIVKVQWTWYGPEDATWEHADIMRAEYPHLFENFEGYAETV